jgi:hypothetical protein
MKNQTLITTKIFAQMLKQHYLYVTRHVSQRLDFKQKIGQSWVYESWEVAEYCAFIKQNKKFSRARWLAWRRERCGV